MTKVSKQARMDAAFNEIAEIIRKEIHNDATIFSMIAQMIPHSPGFAATFAQNVAVVLNGCDDAVDYTEVVVSAYKRTLFPDHPCAVGVVDFFEGDPQRAEEFVSSLAALVSNGGTVMQSFGLLH